VPVFSPRELINGSFPKMNTQTPTPPPSEEEIAVCAFLIWEQEGCPENMDKAHWYQAELQLHV